MKLNGFKIWTRLSLVCQISFVNMFCTSHHPYHELMRGLNPLAFAIAPIVDSSLLELVTLTAIWFLIMALGWVWGDFPAVRTLETAPSAVNMVRWRV